MSEGKRFTWVEFPEEQQVLDDRLFELLQQVIPPAKPEAYLGSAPLTTETIRETVEKMRRYEVERPTWVVPLDVYVEPSIPVNVVHSPLVGPDYFVIIPVDAFDPNPYG